MILILILALILLMITVVGVALLSIGGTAFIIFFGDIIVCVFIIGWIIKRLIMRKQKRRKR